MHRNDRIIDIGEAETTIGTIVEEYDDRAGCRLLQHACCGRRNSVHVLSFVIKHLDDLLSADHLFDKTIQASEIFLLMTKIITAAFPTELNIGEHEDVTEEHDDRQLPVQEKDQCQGAGDLNEALHQHRKTVVERIRDRIDIIGKAAHRISVGVGVKVAQRQRHHPMEQIFPDLFDDPLRDHDHDLCIAK